MRVILIHAIRRAAAAEGTMMEQQADYNETKETHDGLEMFWNEKPKELPSILSGFTPAPDVLIKKYGFVTALVWGRIWRYCQMSDGVCRAKLEKIGDEIGMSVRTIIRHADTLCEGGYLKDMTPELKNRPHIYADTGKIRIRISVETAMTESQPAMTESHSTVTLSHSHHDRESIEESTKKQHKKEKKEKREATPPPAEVTLFRSIVGRYPAKSSYDTVVSSIQKIKARLGRDVVRDDILPFLTAWTDKAWNPLNLAWLKEWAVAGHVPTYQTKGQTNYANRQSVNPVNSGITSEQDAALRRDAERIKAMRSRPNV